MCKVLQIFSFASIVVGTFISIYLLTRGIKTFGLDFSYYLYYLPQAFLVFVTGMIGWAVFGALAKILRRLEQLLPTVAKNT